MVLLSRRRRLRETDGRGRGGWVEVRLKRPGRRESTYKFQTRDSINVIEKN